MFALPYLILWKLFPEKFSRFKIQVTERKEPQTWFEIKYSIFWLNQKNYFNIFNGFGVRGYFTEFKAFIIYFLVYDTYFYWSHRLLHQGWLYKKVHVIHHMSLNPTPFASYSFHPVEAIINLLYFLPLLCFVPMSLEMFILLLVLTDFGNLAGHLGYDFIPKKMWKNRWGSWLTTPTHHNLHHQYSKYNFGLYWRGWDEICKTLRS